jgi:hypothetical protein
LSCLLEGVQSTHTGSEGRDGGGYQISRSYQGGNTVLQEQVRFIAGMTDGTVVTGLSARHSERLKIQIGTSTDSFALFDVLSMSSEEGLAL